MPLNTSPNHKLMQIVIDPELKVAQANEAGSQWERKMRKYC